MTTGTMSFIGEVVNGEHLQQQRSMVEDNDSKREWRYAKHTINFVKLFQQLYENNITKLIQHSYKNSIIIIVIIN